MPGRQITARGLDHGKLRQDGRGRHGLRLRNSGRELVEVVLLVLPLDQSGALGANDPHAGVVAELELAADGG